VHRKKYPKERQGWGSGFVRSRLHSDVANTQLARVAKRERGGGWGGRRHLSISGYQKIPAPKVGLSDEQQPSCAPQRYFAEIFLECSLGAE